MTPQERLKEIEMDICAPSIGPLEIDPRDAKWLIDRVRTLEAALEWYAKKENYLEGTMVVKSVDKKRGTITFGDSVHYGSPAILDEGEVARKALEGDE